VQIPKSIKSMPWPEDFHGGSEHYRVLLSWPVADHERIMVVTFLVNRDRPGWRAEDSARNFRLICSKKQHRAVILYQEERQGKRHRLRKAMWEALTDPKTCYPCLDEKDEAALAKWLGTSETTNHHMEHLSDWVDEALAAEKQDQQDSRGELRIEDVNLCPEVLPAGLEQWVRREIIGTDHTLVYKKGNVRGVCYCCGREVRAAAGQRFRQNEFTTCPNCGERVSCVLSDGDSYHADFVQNIVAAQLGTDGKTVFFRQWHVKRDPTAQYENIAPWLEEFGRYAVRGCRVAKWLHEYKENYCMSAWRYGLDAWTRFEGVSVYDGSYEFYADSVEAAVAGTKLQYADIPGYIQTSWDQYRDGGYGYHNTVRYAMDWARYPVMEFLWKAGYRRLVFQRVAGLNKSERNAIRWNRGALKECFKFPLRLLKLKKPAQWKMADVQKLSQLWEYHLKGALPEADIPEMLRLDLEFKLMEPAMPYASVRKIIKYLGMQQEAAHTHIERTYRDYLQECEQLHLNLHDHDVLFPRDLQEAHNRTMAQITFAKNKANQRAFAAQVAKLERWAWEQGGLMIRPARKQKELSAEGAALHHCVGGYIGRMAKGETAIFFVRRKAEPDKPFFTLELSNSKKVVQCRTLNNKSYDQAPAIKEFVDAWISKCVNKAKKQKKRAAAVA